MIFLILLIFRKAPWTLPSTPNLSPSFPRTADLSLLVPIRGVPPCCIKAKCLTMLTMSRTTLLRSHLAVGVVWGGGRTITWNAKKNTTTRISTSVYQNATVACVRKKLACTSHSTQASVNNVLVYFATVPVSTITNKMRYAHTCGH